MSHILVNRHQLSRCLRFDRTYVAGQPATESRLRNDDLVNEVLEISLSDSSEEFEVLRYKMPAENA
jgi:hypothetical protein